MIARTSWFVLLCSSVLLWHHRDIEAIAGLLSDDRYTHIVVVPVISLALIWFRRKSVFANVHHSPRIGLPLLALGAGLSYLAAAHLGADRGNSHFLASSAIVVSLIAAFALFYGPRAAKAALFPLGLLLLSIPIPPPIVSVAQVALQKASAEVTHVILNLLGIPVFREGMVFALPGVTIEVARECSGIRSGISLFVTGLVLSYLGLGSNWRRACCVLLTVPIAILKNALRISILSLLGAYVSKDYLLGTLHHSGGPLFALFSLSLLLVVLWGLRRNERRAVDRARLGPAVSTAAALEKEQRFQNSPAG